MNSIRLLITDDHEMYLEGLKLLLEKDKNFKITGTAGDGPALMNLIKKRDYDIILLDVNLPGSTPEGLLKELREEDPSAKIIYLTLMRGTRFIHKLMKQNIQGYILKNCALEELKQAIKTVFEGSTYYSKEVDITLPEDDDYKSTLILSNHEVEKILSKREIEVLVLVCKELSSSEIADKLFLSVGTVDTHRKNIMNKLGVSNTVGLVKFALRHGLIE